MSENRLLKQIPFWISIIGLLLSIYGVINKHITLTSFGLFFFVISVALALKLFELNKIIKKSNISIADMKIDALNLANLSKVRNKTLKVQEASHWFKIIGTNLSMTFKYSGYCKSTSGESGFVFNVDSDVNISFAKLTCFGYDLENDPKRSHMIKPFLIGSDGLSKRVKLPFAKMIRKGEQFRIIFYCELPGCIKPGKDYVISSLFFEDDSTIQRFSNHLEFVSDFPKWVRLYDATQDNPTLLKDLKPQYHQGMTVYYKDSYNNIGPDKAFIYLFERKERINNVRI